jgi:phage tail-like protein
LAASLTTLYDSFNFTVDIVGVSAAGFMECVLPVASIDVLEYRDGADIENHARKLPGLTKFGNLTLKRGLTNSLALWDWFSNFTTGKGTPTTVIVTLLDSKRSPAMTWTFTNAWPTKYESPPLNGKGSALAIETLEIVVEDVKVTLGGQGG